MSNRVESAVFFDQISSDKTTLDASVAEVA